MEGVFVNIVKLAYHACIRVQKEALPLIERGHKVYLISWKIPTFVENYRTYTQVFDLHQFLEAIKIYSKVADIFHVHNEPSWFVSAVKEISDVPVVLDVHDSFLARSTPEEEGKRIEEGKELSRIQTEERNNFQLADALIFPGEEFKQVVCNEFNLTQPSIVLPSYLPETLYLYETKEWMGGLIYQGRVDFEEELNKDHRGHGFMYCDYTDLAKKCKELDIDFHIQTVRKDEPFLKVYNDIAYLHEPVGMDKLLKRISRHDWGLLGNVHPSAEWDVAMPNKLFEYLAAGVPVVAINARACSEFIKKYNVGIVIDSLEELKNRWKEHTVFRKNVFKVRQQFAMDNHIHKVEELYAKLLG